MNTRIYCPDIECSSCGTLIQKVLGKKQGVQQVIVNTDSFDVFHTDAVTSAELCSAIHERGFRASTEQVFRKNLRERVNHYQKNKEAYAVEHKMLLYSVLVFLGLMLFEIGAYLLFWRDIPGFFNANAWWFLYITVSVVSLAAASWHLKSYRTTINMMTGMMIGMTFGMQTGMMIGTVLGATNGLFVGGLTALLIGVGMGIYQGKCCGIMGVLEGMMAGVMGGVMGAMTGAMFRFDNLFWFLPFFYLIQVCIIIGLSYMLFEEVVEHNVTITRRPIRFSMFTSFCVIATTLLMLLILYGPKTGVLALG